MEYCKNPEDHISTILERVKPEYIKKTYKMGSWTSTEDFLEQIARKGGRLLKVCTLCYGQFHRCLGPHGFF